MSSNEADKLSVKTLSGLQGAQSLCSRGNSVERKTIRDRDAETKVAQEFP